MLAGNCKSMHKILLGWDAAAHPNPACPQLIGPAGNLRLDCAQHSLLASFSLRIDCQARLLQLHQTQCCTALPSHPQHRAKLGLPQCALASDLAVPLTTSISELCCSLSLISASSRAILAVRMAKLFSRSLQGQALLLSAISAKSRSVRQCNERSNCLVLLSATSAQGALASMPGVASWRSVRQCNKRSSCLVLLSAMSAELCRLPCMGLQSSQHLDRTHHSTLK